MQLKLNEYFVLLAKKANSSGILNLITSDKRISEKSLDPEQN
jgi:hypothetical protein